MQYIKPVEVARQMGIADSTLRRYCSDFAKHLSPDAAPDDAGTRRRFRPSDVAVLKRAKELLDAGNTIEGVNTLLGLDDFSTLEAEEAEEPPKSATTATDATQALVSLLGGQVIATQADQAQRITRQDAELGDLAEQLADLRERLARLEALQESVSKRQDQFDDRLVRLVELLDRMDDHVQSIGQYMHDHSIRIGYRKLG